MTCDFRLAGGSGLRTSGTFKSVPRRHSNEWQKVKKVKKVKNVPPTLGDTSGTSDCAMMDQAARRKRRAADGGGQARSRKAMTLQGAVQAPSELGVSRQKDEPLTDEEELQQAFNQLVKEGVLVDSGRRRPDRNGRMCIIYVHRNFMN